jgi:hypothetical protein
MGNAGLILNFIAASEMLVAFSMFWIKYKCGWKVETITQNCGRRM